MNQQVGTREIFARELSSILGGEVAGLNNPPAGSSRTFWTFDLIRGGSRQPMAALQDTGSGPFFGTSFNMAREAQTLAALRRGGMAVADLHYVSLAGDLMVVDRLPGTAGFAFDNPATRQAVIDSYARALVALHRLDPRDLGLPYAVGCDRAEATLADLDDYQHAYADRCVRHALVDEAFQWSRASVPRAAGPPSLLHGDAGPTNFMHENGRFTGFIDLELSHCGDPVDDLAWIAFRVSVLGFDSRVEDWYEAYVRHGGEPPDPYKLAYYAVLVTLRCTIANLVRQANEPGSSDERAARTRTLLARALADAGGP